MEGLGDIAEMRASEFPPKATAAKVSGGAHQILEGEPSIVPMARYRNDNTIRGHEWSVCCDCGLRHIHVYEVFRIKEGYFLGVRSYPDERTRNRRRRKK